MSGKMSCQEKTAARFADPVGQADPNAFLRKVRKERKERRRRLRSRESKNYRKRSRIWANASDRSNADAARATVNEQINRKILSFLIDVIRCKGEHCPASPGGFETRPYVRCKGEHFSAFANPVNGYKLSTYKLYIAVEIIMERSLKKIREQNEPADLSEILTEARQEGNTSGHNGSVSSRTDGHDNRGVFSKTIEDVPDRAELIRRFNEGIGGKKVPLSSVSNTFQQNTSETSKENLSALETQPEIANRPAVYEANTSNVSSASNISSTSSVSSASSVSSLEEKRASIYDSAANQSGLLESTSIESPKEILLSVRDLYKGYVKASKLIPVLNGVSIDVHTGEFLAVVGQSGSGKSTLLHLMGTLDRPDSGTICFDGQRTDNLPLRKRDFLRNRYIGMIFQFYHLIPEMTTLENVIAPLMIRESVFGYLKNRHRFHQKAKDLLETVGLSHRLRHKPNELSGGEMQRASIARALITEPRILLADEPTGNLDSKTSVGIMKLLRDLNLEKKLTIVMVTHDMEQADDCDRAIRLVDGQIVGTSTH